MRTLRFISGFLCAGFTMLALVYYLLPQLLVDPIVQLNRSLSKLAKQSLMIDDHQVYYLEGGRGDVVILLHGIFAEKDHFVDFARELTGHYRVIIPDIPGFGESSRLVDGQYDYGTQGKRLEKLFSALGLERFHIAGNSMGGTLAALYSIQHPAQVKSLAFIGAPHGLKTPQPSLMDQMIEQRKAPLVVHSAEEFEHMLDVLFFKRPFIPFPIIHKARESSIRIADDNERIFWRQYQDRYILQENISRITAPTLTIWGANEQIFHPSGAQMLKAMLPDQPIIVMPETGHLPQMEKPSLTAKYYFDFVRNLQDRG